MARMAERQLSEFTAQDLTNMAWAFAMVKQPSKEKLGYL